jgi:hypothetical protein
VPTEVAPSGVAVEIAGGDLLTNDLIDEVNAVRFDPDRGGCEALRSERGSAR